MKKIKFLSCAAMVAFMAMGLTSCEKENFNTDTNVTVNVPTINIPGITIPEGYKPGDAVVAIQPKVNALINGEITNVTSEATIKIGGETAKYKVITAQSISAQDVTIEVSYTAVVNGFEKELEATDVVSVPAMEAGMVAVITPTIWLSANTDEYTWAKSSEDEESKITKYCKIENTTNYWYSNATATLKYYAEGSYVTECKIAEGYEDDQEVVAIVDKYTKGLETEVKEAELTVDGLPLYAQSQTILTYYQTVKTTGYEIWKQIDWSRTAEAKVVANFTIEEYSGVVFNASTDSGNEDLKTNVSLDGVGHGHGHGHGHSHDDAPNAGGSIVDAI